MFSPCLCDVHAAHVFPQTGTHAHGNRRDEGEGLADKLSEASRGFLIGGVGQVGIGRWSAYATAPTYRKTNPHFISHICSIAQKQTDPGTENKEIHGSCLQKQLKHVWRWLFYILLELLPQVQRNVLALGICNITFL